MSNNDNGDSGYSFLADLNEGLGQDDWDQLFGAPVNPSQLPQDSLTHHPPAFSQNDVPAQPTEAFQIQGQSQPNPFQSQPGSHGLPTSQPFSSPYGTSQFDLALPTWHHAFPPQGSPFLPPPDFSSQQSLPLPQPVFPAQRPASQANNTTQSVDDLLASVGGDRAVLEELARSLAGSRQQVQPTQTPISLATPIAAQGMNPQESQKSVSGGFAHAITTKGSHLPSLSGIAPLGHQLQVAGDGLPYHTDPPADRRDPGNPHSREIAMKKNNAFWSDRSDRAEWSRKYDNFYGKIRPHILPIWGPSGKFEYDANGELVKGRTFSRNQIYYYLYNNPRRLTLMLQLAPSKLLVRMSDSSCSCRWKGCPNTNKTIHNTHMVTFQEFQPEVEAGRHNPYRCAGMVHLFCFEQMFDIVPMIQSGLFRPEHHRLPAERDNNLSIERDRKGVIENAYNKWVRGRTHKPHPRAYPDSLQYALTLHFHDTRPQSHKRQAEKRDKNRGRPTVSAVHVHWNDLRISANLKPSGISEAYRNWYRETYGAIYNPHQAIQELINAGHREDDSLEVAIQAAEGTGAPRPIFREAPETGLPVVPSVRPVAAAETPSRKRRRQCDERDERAAKRSKRHAESDSGSSLDGVVPAAPPIMAPPHIMAAAAAASQVLPGEAPAGINNNNTDAGISVGSPPNFGIGNMQALAAHTYDTTGTQSNLETNATLGPDSTDVPSHVPAHTSGQKIADEAGQPIDVDQYDDLFEDDRWPSMDLSEDIDKLLSYGEF